MSNQKIGGAHYTLSVNADKFASGLAQAKQKAQRFKKDTDDVWGKIGERFGGGGGGFLAKALGAGFFGGIAGSLAIKAMNFIADGISDVWSETSKWTQELGRAQLAAQMVAREFEFARKVRDEWIDANRGPRREGLLRNERMEAEFGRRDALAEAERIRQRLELINSFGVTNTTLALTGELSKEKAFLAQALAEAERKAGDFSGRLLEVGERLKRLDPKNDPAVKAGINAYLDELTRKTELLGLSAEEAALRLLELRGGPSDMLDAAREKTAGFITEQTVRDAKAYTKELERLFDVEQKGLVSEERLKFLDFEKKAAAEGWTDVTEKMRENLERLEGARRNTPAREFLQGLEAERRAMEMGSVAAKLYELRVGGAAKSIIEAAAVEAAFIERMEALKNKTSPKFQLAGAIESGSAAAYSLNLKHSLDRPGGADPNKGMTLWDVVQTLIEARKTLDKIEKKIGPAGVL